MKRPRLITTIIAIALLVAGLVGGVAAIGSQASGATLADWLGVKVWREQVNPQDIIDQTNQYRVSKGLTPLAKNDMLMNSAQAKAEDMVLRGYWSHNTPENAEPWVFFDKSGYSYINAGENLASGGSSIQRIVNGWIESPTHEANLVGDYTEVGIGVLNDVTYQGKTHQYVVVAHYGKQ